MTLWIINGPNLNFIGIREPHIYGQQTYSDFKTEMRQFAKQKNIRLRLFQTNYEGKIIDLIQKAHFKHIDAMIINPGALSHTSYAIYDAIKGTKIRVVEVHLTDLSQRESFRQQSITRGACENGFSGKHFESYKDAIRYIIGEPNV